MCRVNVQIEDRLHSAGYRTDRDGDVVRVYDPVHALVSGATELVTTHFGLLEIRTTGDAWAFVAARA